MVREEEEDVLLRILMNVGGLSSPSSSSGSSSSSSSSDLAFDFSFLEGLDCSLLESFEDSFSFPLAFSFVGSSFFGFLVARGSVKEAERFFFF